MVADSRDVDRGVEYGDCEDVAELKAFAKRRPGRPTDRNAILDEVARRALAIGLTYKLTAELIGVDPRTFRQWRAKDPDYSAFLKSGRAAGIMRALSVVNNKIDAGNLDAAKWYCENIGSELMPGAKGDPDELGEDMRSTAEALHAECMAMRATATAL